MAQKCTCCGDTLPPIFEHQFRCPPCELAVMDLPTAYYVHRGPMDGCWYPMRYGAYRYSAMHDRISFETLAEAVAYCQREQAELERWRPSTPPTGGAA